MYSLPPPQQPIQSPFLRLPPELRLQIYELLLHPTIPSTTTNTLPPIPANYTFYDTTFNTPSSLHTLCIRAEDPDSYALRRPNHTRSTFLIHSGSLRTQCRLTTYFLLQPHRLCTSFLRANAQIHAEAARVLYASHTFDFDTHIEGMIAFLGDLTTAAREVVRSVRVVKGALCYDTEFDRAEWGIAMEGLRQLPELKNLCLGIVTGKPEGGYLGVEPYRKKEFEGLMQREGMEWVGQLEGIRVARLDVQAVVEYCPLPRSEGMARFIRFSASVEGSFGEFLRGRMAR